MLTVYGIKSCDTCRKALRFLEAQDIEHKFHDVRDDGLNIKMLERWADHVGWEKLLNKRSLTWRKIPDVDRHIENNAGAIALMLDYPTLIKRPVLCHGRGILIGFDADEYDRRLNGTSG